MSLKLSCSIDNTEMNICKSNFIVIIFMQYELSMLYVNGTVHQIVQKQKFSVQGNTAFPKISLMILVVVQSFSW